MFLVLTHIELTLQSYRRFALGISFFFRFFSQTFRGEKRGEGLARATGLPNVKLIVAGYIHR